MTQNTGARILVVDDEAAIVRAVQTNLGRHEFHVAPGSQRIHLVLVAILPDNVKSIGADRTGGTEDGEVGHAEPVWLERS